ncbi:MarR family winged helix-turn-helix transcriptional regulator [Heliobacterium mobile]|nr:MarR family transcriptional regulator [Heliobacterium mobile]
MEDGVSAKELREIIRQLERKLGILEKNEMGCCGVSFAQCHAIVEIGRGKKVSLNLLADSLGLDSSTMSRTVNNLVNNGFVQRELDPGDRRYVTIQLTESGNKVFQHVEETMNNYFQGVWERIPNDKRAQILDSFQILLTAFQ